MPLRTSGRSVSARSRSIPSQVAAGLLNVLAMVDAYEIAAGAGALRARFKNGVQHSLQ